MLNIAVRAARKAGNLIAKNYETPDAVEASQKGSNDFVTNVDKAAEAVIIDTIRKSYPQHTIITEESGELEGTDQDVQWVIDPLDGTTNFIKRLPHFAVSIAVRIKGRTEVAVVYDPMRNELFTATRGQGAQLNGYRLRGSNRSATSPEGYYLATGFPSKQTVRHTYINISANCQPNVQTSVVPVFCRRWIWLTLPAGRVAVSLKSVLRPWDFAAGELLVS
ncbi:inositol-1-monophosphatase [Escherichia coli]|nr:inositol-1-monophosphatase [Escherichia coli]